MRSARLNRVRSAGALALVSALTLTALAACGTSSSDDGDGSRSSGSGDPATPLDPKTKVTLTIDCMPPTAKAAELKEWKEDVKEFNKTYPNVTVEGRSTPGQCLEPPRFTAMLKARSQPDVFYTYFTDLPQVLDNDGAEDITAYVNDTTVPLLKDIDPDVLGSLRHDGKLYGLPTSNYTMGLLINRKLFERAGLDPDSPPGTWDEALVEIGTSPVVTDNGLLLFLTNGATRVVHDDGSVDVDYRCGQIAIDPDEPTKVIAGCNASGRAPRTAIGSRIPTPWAPAVCATSVLGRSPGHVATSAITSGSRSSGTLMMTSSLRASTSATSRIGDSGNLAAARARDAGDRATTPATT